MRDWTPARGDRTEKRTDETTTIVARVRDVDHPAWIRGVRGRGRDDDDGHADGSGIVTRNVHRRDGNVDEGGNATRGDEE